MKIRNSVYNTNGRIDCEIEHPALGWIPFTAAADDPDPQGLAIYEQVIAEGDISSAAPETITNELSVSEKLNDLCHKKRVQITVARDAAINGGISHAGYDWDTDDVSRGYLTGAVVNINAGIPLPEGFSWTAADDSDVPMDASGLIALGAAVTLHVNTQHVKSRILKARIKAVGIPEGGTIDDAAAALDLITW